ncbi:CHAT domain containing protein [Lactarius tabidus]
MGTQQYHIDNEITAIQHTLSALPRHDPERRLWLLRLAIARAQRYGLSDQMEDLDKHVLHASESILIPPWDGHHEGLALFHIACALLHRSERFQRVEDVKYSIQYLLYLRNTKLPIETCGLSRITVMEFLVPALATYIEIEAGDETQIIEAMIGFCNELLASEISENYPVDAFVALGRAIHIEFSRGLEMRTLDRVVECLREAVNKYPSDVQEVHQVHLDLAMALQFRSMKTYTASDDDYMEAIVILDKIIDTSHLGDGDNPSPYSAEASLVAARLVILRCRSNAPPEYTEEAISRCHSWLSCSSLGYEGRSTLSMLLEWLTAERSKQFGLTGSLHKDDSGAVIPLLTSTRHMRHPTTTSPGFIFERMDESMPIESEARNLSKSSARVSKQWVEIAALAFRSATRASRSGDIMDIEEAIKYQRLALSYIQKPSPDTEFSYLNSLGRLLYEAFSLNGRMELLEESISVDLCALETTASRPFSPSEVLLRLSTSLIDRWRFLGRTQDLDESMRLYHLASNDLSATAPERIDRACLWASRARDTKHSSVLNAYQSGMSLIQSAVIFAPTLEIQHAHLFSKKDIPKMPLEYASYLIHIGQLEQAIEALEQGRALLWSEMRGFRTSTDQLRRARPELADRLMNISNELETVTTSILQRSEGRAHTDKTDRFGRILTEQRMALEERDDLLSYIRGLPGFEDLLKAPRFDSLRAAAAHGPVIIINHCKWRSDILILLHNSPPSLIPTVDGFYDRANRLKDNLVETRNRYSPGSKEYGNALRSTLEDLYTLVGRPVIEKLRKLQIPEQSRVWWCPTSVFCALPLHAMGPILSDGKELYFSDIYISSYTPTLSALIQSQASSTLTSDRPSLLLVGRPNDGLPGVWEEIRAIETQHKNTIHTLVSEDATLDDVKQALPVHPFLHLACHGNLETGKPFEAWFKLEGKDRLTLLEIVRSHLPTAEFAFLSACHSAELTDKSLADEALHLAAAMQYCGFRSVIGTLWAVVDEDGPELAKHFYKSLSSSEGKKTPAYRRSARALRNAVQKLRRKRGVTLERWVNFVHYGA